MVPDANDKNDIPEAFTQNIQLLIEVETKAKLNVVDHNGNKMIETKTGSSSDHLTEVHYMLIENVLEEYSVGWKLLLKPFKSLLTPQM